MKKTYLALALALLLPAQAMADVQIRVNPLDSLLDLSTGVDSLFIDLVGSYTGSGNLLGGAVSLSFDPSVLQVVNVTLKAPQDISGKTGVIDNALGTIKGIGFASFAGVSGNFNLATVEFHGVGAGISQLNVTDANDLIYAWVNDVSGGQVVNFSGMNGSVTVAAVPEPETWAMLLAGLGLVGFSARRRVQLAA